MMYYERLQKVIAHSGITSRRKAEKMIVAGNVKVNGKTVTTLGTKVTAKDHVEVNGIPLQKEQPVYYLFYKPRGVISSVHDEKGRKVVTDFFPHVKERIYPIGRLDYQSSGILLLTNDGEFAHLMMHPKHEIDKVYIIKIRGIPSKTELEHIKTGIEDQGDILKATHYRVYSTNQKTNTMLLQITLREGKNRHIRRMMDQLGYPVVSLKRKKFGFLHLSHLQPGEYRTLKREEINQLRKIALKNVEK